MPILKASNPAILIVPDQFQSWLPENTISSANAAPIIRSMTTSGFGQGYMRNATVLSGQIGRTVAMTFGWPELEIGKLAKLAESVMGGLDIAAVAKMFDTLSDIVPEIMFEVSKAISDAISGIPIVGWLAKIGFGTWNLIKTALQLIKPTTEHRAIGYSRELDQFATNELLNIVRSDDWSEIFRPPNGDFSWKPIAYTNSGAADGVAWGQIDAKGQPTSLRGVMPGVAGIAGYWQTPRDMPGSSRMAGRESIIGQGQMLPSVVALCGQLWAMMQRPGTAFGRVDFVGLRNDWRDYGKQVREFGKAQHYKGNERGEWIDRQIQSAFSYADQHGAAFYGISANAIPKTYREHNGGPGGYGLDALIAYKCDQAWVRIVQAMGKGDAVAYMAPDCPFLSKADSGLRQLHFDLRKDLLQRFSTLANVDVSIIPDKQYRDAVIAAQENVPQRTPTPEPQQGGGAPTIPPIPAIVMTNFLPPDVPKPKPGEDKPDLPALPGAGGGGGAALVIAVMALLFGL